MLAKLARFSFRKKWIVVLIWLILLGGLSVWLHQIGTTYATEFKLPSSDSQDALTLLKDKFPSQSGATGDLVFKATAGLENKETIATVNSVIEQIKALPHVTTIQSPYSPTGASQVSPNGTIAKAVIQFDEDQQTVTDDQSLVKNIKSIAGGKTLNGVQFELGGQLFQSQPSTSGSEAVGLIAAIFILLIAFGSVLAMGIPIITALMGIGTGVASIGLLTHVLSLPNFTTELASMIGLGVGIDYALFIVTRYRQGLNEGLAPEQATVTAINTAGRSVLFAGITVVISLLGMVLINVKFVQGMGIGAAVVVLITILASITLLPALLGIIGKNIDKIRLPFTSQTVKPIEESVWYRWSNVVQRHPWPVLLGGLSIVILLAIPVFSIRLGFSDASSLRTTDTTRRAYDLEAQGFGVGSNGPLLIVASIQGASDLSTMQKVQKAITADSDVAFISPPIPNKEMTAALLTVIPKTSPQDQGTVDLIHRLRNTVIPKAISDSKVQVHVGGITATFDDIAQALTSRLPLFIGTVLILSFLLLMIVFRSILIPLKAVLLNIFSIGASYGVLVAIFQWGWFNNFFRLGSTGPIESFLPMMLFAILFGLSMDYEVFLLSNIKEEYDRVPDNSRAIAHGLGSTARVITAAAAIMIMVFASFVFGDQRIIKEFGIGLASAVLIDAVIARLLLVPATMQLFGKANWWLPKWLQWLPKVHIDGNEV